MESFDLNFVNSKRLDVLRELAEYGQNLGLTDMGDLLKKVDSVRKMINDENLRIVLLGSFSDGKTSAIAGLLGRLEDTMKIDQDESSDDLQIYRFPGLDKVEFVDTPGLFGTKEKEVDGKEVKYSDITKKYLSESQIVVYVCDAVNPLKDSHVPVMKWILRDLKKLDSTVFVINKMDEAGYDLTDPEEYEQAKKIKKENLTSRLRNSINLTPQEEANLHIVCVAADPKGKGLSHWFSKPDDYLRRSHIDSLREALKNVIDSSNEKDLNNKAIAVSIDSTLASLENSIDDVSLPIGKALNNVKVSFADLETDKRNLKSQLDRNQSSLVDQLDNYKMSLFSDIAGASVETIGEVIDRALGMEDGNVTFYVFQRKINQMISACVESNDAEIKSVSVRFEQEFNEHEQFLNGALKKGAGLLKNVKVSNTQVKAVRDAIAASYKFKPWGAVKLAANITKWMGRVAVGIQVAIEAISFIKALKSSKELDKTKRDLKSAIDSVFSELYHNINGDAYYTNFAPSYMDMCNQLEERKRNVETLEKKLAELEAFKQRVIKFNESQIEDVEFE
ncbi:MAG: 50S ribosome-binding GTPase [Paludibacteraceae bacterium]|nr:50S ribosome-binding GTPase [Paludibacteraceae bacterium]